MAGVVQWIEGAVERLRAFAYGPPRRREPERPRVGLALGGGFARGLAHIGVLRVLEEHDIPIDCIAGTSVGALIATAYASGVPLDEMEKQASATRFSDFGKWTFSLRGMATNLRLENFLHRLTQARYFEELRIPLSIVATDLMTGTTVGFQEGELGPPLRASCAYPGLFLPVEHQGHVLVDGFLTAQVPSEAARAMGADIVIAVYLQTGGLIQPPKTVIEVIGRSFSILQQSTEQRWRTACDAVIEPEVKQFVWDDFQRAPELVKAGEAATRAMLPKIRAVLAPETTVAAAAPDIATPEH